MKPLTIILGLFLTTMGANSIAQIQNPLTVDDAIAIAIENNQNIKAQEYELQASNALLKTVGELPKLEVGAQLGQYNSTRFDQAFEISQSIPFPTLFTAKREAINAEIKGQEIQKSLSELELKNQVRLLFYQIQYLQHNQKQFQELNTLYNDFIRVAELRYRVGDTQKVDISTAKAKQGEMNLISQQNEVLLANAKTQLQALLNSSEDVTIAESNPFSPIQIDAMVSQEAMAKSHPAIQALYQQAVIAEQNKKVERSQGLPEFTVGYNNQSLIGMHEADGVDQFFGADKRFSSFSVGVAIPLTFGATKARVQSLEFKRQAAEANAQLQQKVLEAQIENTLKQYEQNKKEFNYFQQQATPNAKEIVSAAQLGYKTGEASYVEYLFALQTAVDIQLAYLESIDKVNQSVINFYALINK